MTKERYSYTGSRRKTQRATMFTVACPEVVLPTYMASAFGLNKGVSLVDI
jgi:hypothetical protein